MTAAKCSVYTERRGGKRNFVYPSLWTNVDLHLRYINKNKAAEQRKRPWDGDFIRRPAARPFPSRISPRVLGIHISCALIFTTDPAKYIICALGRMHPTLFGKESKQDGFGFLFEWRISLYLRRENFPSRWRVCARTCRKWISQRVLLRYLLRLDAHWNGYERIIQKCLLRQCDDTHTYILRVFCLLMGEEHCSFWGTHFMIYHKINRTGNLVSYLSGSGKLDKTYKRMISLSENSVGLAHFTKINNWIFLAF